MNEPIKKQAGSVVRLTRALRAPQGKPGKKELEANFPRLSEKHWHVDDWTHVDGARLQPEPVALIARRRSHRRLLFGYPTQADTDELTEADTVRPTLTLFTPAIPPIMFHPGNSQGGDEGESRVSAQQISHKQLACGGVVSGLLPCWEGAQVECL